jgi:hypothetical protein
MRRAPVETHPSQHDPRADGGRAARRASVSSIAVSSIGSAAGASNVRKDQARLKLVLKSLRKALPSFGV